MFDSRFAVVSSSDVLRRYRDRDDCREGKHNRQDNESNFSHDSSGHAR
jgi:hypothetical protein